MPLFPEDPPDILCRDDLAGSSHGQLAHDPSELGVIVGPAEILQQCRGLRFRPQDGPGKAGVQVTDREPHQFRDPGGHLPQRRQVQGEAVELIAEQRSHFRDIFSRLADAGEHDPVTAADLHFQKGFQQLLPVFPGKGIDVGKVNGGLFICQRRVVVFQQKRPTLVIEQTAVDRHQRVIAQLPPQIEGADHALLSGAVLPGDHHRGTALADLFHIVVEIADGARKTEDAVVKRVFRLRPGGEVDPGLVWRQRRLAGDEKERDQGQSSGRDAPGANGVGHPVEIADDPPFALPPGLRQFPLQQRHQLHGGLLQRG